jgi:hypothetical protein
MSGASKLDVLCTMYLYASHPFAHTGQLAAGTLASSYEYICDRAYIDPRGRRRVLSQALYKPRGSAPRDLCHVRRA